MVKIEIDTNKDSAQDIRRAIELLKKFVGDETEKQTAGNDFDMPSQSAMDIFGSSEDSAKKESDKDEPEKIDLSDLKIEPY